MASDRKPAIKDFLHMNGGNGEFSYAINSSNQESLIRKVHPILKEIIKGIANDPDGFPPCFHIADLGCSSGPNTLFFVSNIMEEVHEVCKEKKLKPPQFQVFLNDLFGNDFNTLFGSLPTFYAKRNKDNEENFGRCFISAVPGSFYGRLFPDQSIHFFHSSGCLHWLSQVPKDIENNGLNVFMAKTSPPNVFEMYKMQFQNDFTAFLESRSKEIIRGGHMLLTFGGRSNVDPYCNNSHVNLWELFTRSLADMVKEGIVTESQIAAFNVPTYNPYKDEVRDLVHIQGSFSLDTLDTFEVNWYTDDTDDDHGNVKARNQQSLGKRAAKMIRAGSEPMLITYFGSSAMDLIFQKFEKYMDEHLANTEETKPLLIVISLTKK
uniref:benzoate carboxyl methyltransferase-like n=1 Tax=Erigeron canadensis TaxID=72917 RepID=UPI001CB9C05C|nr:benzoate carboxyl methyltransferase-like [Erigeron canadensis]